MLIQRKVLTPAHMRMKIGWKNTDTGKIHKVPHPTGARAMANEMMIRNTMVFG
jgi:hypothetical protein